MKKIVLITVGSIAVVILALLTIFGQRGTMHLMQLEKQVSEISMQNRQLQMQNERLREEIRLLRQSDEYIEDVARKELGLVKDNELVYHLEKVTP